MYKLPANKDASRDVREPHLLKVKLKAKVVRRRLKVAAAIRLIKLENAGMQCLKILESRSSSSSDYDRSKILQDFLRFFKILFIKTLEDDQLCLSQEFLCESSFGSLRFHSKIPQEILH